MNKNFYNKLVIKNKEYFDNLFNEIDSNIILDKQQRIAIVMDSKYMMILAGAGSGKTTTITAKVKYLVEKMNINEEEILLLSFTNKAVYELKERINIDFGLKIKIKTFHSLGYEIIKCWNNDIRIISNSEEILKDIISKNVNIKIKRCFKELFLKDKFEETCITFIKLLKAKDYNEQKLSQLKTKNKKCNQFIDFISILFSQYQKYLLNNNLVDYDDLILKASDVIENLQNKLQYKYVLIDEYQDISLVRFNLIKKILNLTNSKLIVVGDDWQSIYSFSGSEVNLFHEFLKLEGAEIIKITNTYRNSQQLIDIAGKFVMKNKMQLKKTLKSNKKMKKPVEIIYYNDISCSYSNMLNAIETILNQNRLSEFALLSRYNHDLDKIRKEKFNNKIFFMTVHSSKGLGFENVILLNVADDLYGFPTKIDYSEYDKLLIKNDLLNEERRLFYVALTRTKNKVYILVPKSKPSPFVKEIEKYKNVKIVK